MYRYFISPGFFVQVASGSLSSIEAIGCEKKRGRFQEKTRRIIRKRGNNENVF